MYNESFLIDINFANNILFIRTDRYCKKTTMVNGVTFPKRAVVTVPISVLHYSPLYWTDPEKFDPERLAEIRNSF